MNLNYAFLLGKAALACHLLGIVSAAFAIMGARTSQGAIAWAISLISFPYVALPLFWIFGRDRFHGYTVGRREKDSQINHIRGQIIAKAGAQAPELAIECGVAKVFEGLAHLRFTGGNEAALLVNGQATFDAIFAGIDSAKQYLLVQFFLVHDDDIGRAFQKRLLAAARRGVKIYFLFDEVGSHALPGHYIESLRQASIDIRAFKTTKGILNRFQLNFRNHRKIVVVDGRVAYVGGLNVGDEYLGRDPTFGLWRDTHVRIEGPSVLQVQASFAEDWHWSSDVIPADLNWDYRPVPNGKAALVLPSGPADKLDTCCLMFLQAIQMAKKRIWITSPYFVPDPQIISALQLAALRGVDVRLLLPNMPDHIAVYLASFSYLKDVLPYNVKVSRFQGGFLHEKVLLVDDVLSAVGTANFDNRSFRLNFEMTLLFADPDFAKQIEAMLLDDFAHAKPATLAEITDRPWYFKVAVQVARLMAPIL